MKRNNRGFTLIELLIVIAIIGVLIAMLAPAIASTRTRSQMATCMNNMRQIAMAALMYADDNNEKLPDVTDTVNYIDNPTVYNCPQDHDPTSPNSYAAWISTPASLLPSASPNYSSNALLYVESEKTKNQIDAPDKLAYRHNNRTIVVFADCHAMSGTLNDVTVFMGIGAGGGGGSGME